MKSPLIARALGAALITLALTGTTLADATDYEFQLVKNELKKGDAVIDVRLIDKRNGSPISDAVIFAKRIDMAPDSMAGMDCPLNRKCPESRGFTASRPNSPWPGGGNCRLPPRFRVKPGQLKTS